MTNARSMKIAVYVAIAENGVIGRDGGLPWRLRTDMQRFKATTMGKPIVMGRKTWESFPRRPLPGRANIVVSRDKDFKAEGADLTGSLEEAIALARSKPIAEGAKAEICILGGGQIYAQALPFADRLYVTHVLGTVDGDTRFPAIDPQQWAPVSVEDVPAGEKDTHPTRYVVYDRIDARRG